MELQRDLREFIELFNSQGVEFLVVGAHAVAFHGYPRFTGDIDLLVNPTEENAERILAALRRFGFPHPEELRSDLTRRETVIQIGRPPNRVDLLTSVSGLEFGEAWTTAVPSTLDGIPVRFPDLPSLLRNKRASGRAKDLADVEELDRIAGQE